MLGAKITRISHQVPCNPIILPISDGPISDDETRLSIVDSEKEYAYPQVTLKSQPKIMSITQVLKTVIKSKTYFLLYLKSSSGINSQLSTPRRPDNGLQLELKI